MIDTSADRVRRTPAWFVPGCVMALLAPLAACSSADRVVNGPIVSDDYRVRHPIVLAEQPRTLDIFVAGRSGQLDRRTIDQLRQFAASARSSALAPIELLLPRGTGHDMAARAALPAIERELTAGGARGYVNVGTYPAAEPGLASPIRLSFEALKAQVTSQCGQWPRDLASGSTIDGWENRHYWNYGCAYQTNLAAQVADPRDLVSPQAESPSDIQMRMRAIGSVRKGADPGTVWTVKNTNLGAAGG